jgi:hypothetical protein
MPFKLGDIVARIGLLSKTQFKVIDGPLKITSVPSEKNGKYGISLRNSSKKRTPEYEYYLIKWKDEYARDIELFNKMKEPPHRFYSNIEIFNDIKKPLYDSPYTRILSPPSAISIPENSEININDFNNINNSNLPEFITRGNNVPSNLKFNNLPNSRPPTPRAQLPRLPASPLPVSPPNSPLPPMPALSLLPPMPPKSERGGRRKTYNKRKLNNKNKSKSKKSRKHRISI